MKFDGSEKGWTHQISSIEGPGIGLGARNRSSEADFGPQIHDFGAWDGKISLRGLPEPFLRPKSDI